MPTVADIQQGGTLPVAFIPRKPTESQNRTWSIRDKEAYAVVSAEKWATWIGQQPVMILTDHKPLEH